MFWYTNDTQFVLNLAVTIPTTLLLMQDGGAPGGGPIAELKDLFRKKGAAALPQVNCSMMNVGAAA